MGGIILADRWHRSTTRWCHFKNILRTMRLQILIT